MASKSSWRLKFIDIDSSFSISTEAGTIKGYMVVRAPKGEIEPYYFEKGNQAAIEAYVGLGGSDYPDIGEAIAFNREYGIYISAPAGASDEYPSYIGGVYLTTEGQVPLYKVPDKEQIDYTKKIDIEDLGDATITVVPNPTPYDGALPDSLEESQVGKEDTYAFLIEKIPAEKWDTLKEIAIMYSGDSINGQAPGTYYYEIDKDSHKLFCKDAEGELIEDAYVGLWGKSADKENYYIVLGGSDWFATAGEALSKAKDKPLKEILSNPLAHWTEGYNFTENGKQSDFGKYNKVDITYSTNSISFPNNDPETQELTPTYTFNVKVTGAKVTFTDAASHEPQIIIEDAAFKPDSSDAKVTAINAVNEAMKNDTALKALGLNSITSNNKSGMTEIPFYTLNSIAPNLENTIFVSTYKETGDQIVWGDVVAYMLNNFTGAKWENTAAIKDGATYPLIAFSDFSVDVDLLVDIKNITFATIIQKSPSEIDTKITLNSVGYDKWLFDQKLEMICPAVSSALSDETLANYLKENNIRLFLGPTSKPTADMAYPTSEALTDVTREVNVDLWEFNKDLPIKKAFKKVTSDYLTQDILIGKTTVYGDAGKSEGPKSFFEVPGVTDKIFLVKAKGKLLVESDKENKMWPSGPFLKADINFNTFSFSVAEEVYSAVNLTSGGTFHGSMDENGRDSYGGNIYWPNVLNENDFSFVEIIPNNTLDSKAMGGIVNPDGIYKGVRLELNDPFKMHGQRFMTHLTQLNKEAGMIGGAWRDEMMAICEAGWVEAYDTNYDDVYVFMEPTGQNQLKGQLASLVEGTHKLAVAIAPLPMTKAQAANPATVVVPVKNKQVAVYAGEFMMYDSRTGKNYYTCPIGDIGKMCCRIIDKKMGGWAPAWYNYNSMGGQLDRAVLKAKYNFSDPATEIMDKKGINPIVYNADDGLMIVSSKTTQDPNNLTDWSFLEHVLAFCLVKREIRDNVMRPQIEKPIDDYWMSVRQTQTDAILSKRISGPNKIWTAATCDIAGVNTDVTKAQRKFCIYVKVKVTPFAQTVELTLENVAQTTNL